MRSSSRRALAALHDVFWALLVLAPAGLFVLWARGLPDPPRRVTWETAYDPFWPLWGMVLLFGVVSVVVLFLAEYATRRMHRWARSGH